ncbi:hypothetical protein GTO27_04940 [Candidatus Bathyarchaeota archaeon]|nr:hypothetical protein [Candidatus Bathyarchaeota archaeon]
MPNGYESSFPMKPMIGTFFSLICVFGLLAALLPRHCSRGFHFVKKNAKKAVADTSAVSIKGHHPDCEGFSAHVIRIDNYVLCAACVGLSLGALISLAGTIFYFFLGWNISETSLPAVFIGALGVAVGFIQMKFKGLLRLALNAIFVIGAFLVLIGVCEQTQSPFASLFVIVLIVFWILTRILLSQSDHNKICRNCKSPCEIY